MWLALGALGFVVAVSLVHVWLVRLHSSLREELADADVLLATEAVRASVSARATLSASTTSLTGDLLVTDRAVVLFPRSRGIPMLQPPVVLVRAGKEDAVRKRWGVTRFVAGEGPRRERSITSVPRVAIHSAGARRWVLRVETENIESLLGALREFMGDQPLGGPYRAKQPETAVVDTPVTSPFVEGFLQWDPEMGFRQSPFTEPVGHRDGVVCFASDAADEGLWRVAGRDLDTLGALQLGETYYGAASYAVEAFLAGDPGAGALTGARVLEALRARNFTTSATELASDLIGAHPSGRICASCSAKVAGSLVGCSQRPRSQT